ncbi:MAG: IS1182 family transposase [Clostridiales bacterium]|nr:IS1182 family transposase [Clostridiales bacterium]
MGRIEGTDREQIQLMSYENFIGEDNMVRVIDRFVDVCDLEKLGFQKMQPAQTGRPSYPPEAMAKLYVYGYENGIRSSRKIEKETLRNVEVMWLINNLQPDYKTIAEFRRENIRPFQKLFKEFVRLCKSWELIGGELIAVDGTKIKASNNKKTNFSRKKLDDRIKRIDKQIEQYLADVEEADKRETTSKSVAPKNLDELIERKELYENYIAQLDETGENEISQVDPDARLMGNNRGGVDVAYNVQSAVDSKNHIILDYDVSQNPADHGQLGNMVKKVKKALKLRRFTVVADKGYYQGEDLLRVKKLKVTSIVSRQKPGNPKDQPKEFHSDKFLYNEKEDTYTCPTGKTLYPHSKETAARRNYHNKEACLNCEYCDVCSKGQRGFRAVTRSQYAKIYEETNKRMQENMDIYRLRQQIVEHPFGTVKHSMHGYYFLLRTRRKVRTEVALLFLGYNLKRAYKVLGFSEIMARLDAVSHCLFRPLLHIDISKVKGAA